MEKNDGFETIRTATPLSAISLNGIDAHGLVPVSHCPGVPREASGMGQPPKLGTLGLRCGNNLLIISNFDIPPR